MVRVIIKELDVHLIIRILKKDKLFPRDLSKQQKLNIDPKAIQQINSTGNLARAEGARMFLITEEVEKAILDISKGTSKVL